MWKESFEIEKCKFTIGKIKLTEIKIDKKIDKKMMFLDISQLEKLKYHQFKLALSSVHPGIQHQIAVIVSCYVEAKYVCIVQSQIKNYTQVNCLIPKNLIMVKSYY